MIAEIRVIVTVVIIVLILLDIILIKDSMKVMKISKRNGFYEDKKIDIGIFIFLIIIMVNIIIKIWIL